MSTIQQHRIRPYARLLTMLGEQLIKNERIALMEIIKNSYDADSKWVKITFENFEEDYSITSESKIIIEDAGDGMSLETIKNCWLNPATPNKLQQKKDKPKTKLGRIVQGEKGIGRFAVLKLGRVVEIITKTENDVREHVVRFDFSDYDDDFLSVKNSKQEIFLDEIEVSIFSRPPRCFIENTSKLGNNLIKRPAKGTKIEISELKGSWTQNKVEKVFKDVSRLQPIFESFQKNSNDFRIYFYINDNYQHLSETYLEKLKFLLKERAVLKIENGRFDIGENVFTFNLNKVPYTLLLNDPLVRGDLFFRKRFGKEAEVLNHRDISCGSFSFEFYIFDLAPRASIKYKLDNDDKQNLREHRIYLYRDGIRVYPYGDPDDDWLRIDVTRGTISASTMLSNDQIVGVVNITQKENPDLKDKTNREGLIEHGTATEDFITLIQIFLSYIRKRFYSRYLIDQKNKNAHDVFKTGQVQQSIDELKASVPDNKKAQEAIESVTKAYQTERNYLVHRAEATEELAGVGLSVETASHDIMAILGKVFLNIDSLISELMGNNELDREYILKELQSIRGGFSFIESQLRDIQLLFKSTKKRRKSINVSDIIVKVERLYKNLMNKQHITCSVKTIGSPLLAKTTDAVLLQLLLNLFDNSVYWLSQIDSNKKEINIILNGSKGQMIFADNGPGISTSDSPYIFEPFYSGKGEEGRGLGLYIARQLLDRYDYSIDLVEIKSEKVLSGANFVVSFIAEDK